VNLHKEYLNTVTHNTPVLPWINKLNSLMHRMLLYVNVYGTYKLSKKQSSFLAHSLEKVAIVAMYYHFRPPNVIAFAT